MNTNHGNLGENVRYFRRLCGMTQAELAEKAGYHSKTAISRIEHGEWEPSPTKLGRLAKVLGISPNLLLGFEEEPANQEKEELDFSEVEQEKEQEKKALRQEAFDDFRTLFALSSKATPEQLQSTIDYLRFLTKDNSSDYDGIDVFPDEEDFEGEPPMYGGNKGDT